MLNFAIQTAREAGQVLADKFGRALQVSNKGDIDLVTEADLAAERLIIERIRSYYPRHRVLSEEAGAGRRYDLVLVDPPYRMFSDVQTGLATYLPSILAEQGLAVVETHAKEEPELPLAVRTSRRYGSARLTLFEHE